MRNAPANPGAGKRISVAVNMDYMAEASLRLGADFKSLFFFHDKKPVSRRIAPHRGQLLLTSWSM